MNDEEFGLDRKRFLAACPIHQRSRIAEAINKLDGFSKAHPDSLTVAASEHLVQTSIGFDLCTRDSMLWKAYAGKLPKLEVLAHAHRTLADPEAAAEESSEA